MIRLGLCCGFVDEPIRFRTATARYVGGLPAREQIVYLHDIVVHNAHALLAAVTWCRAHGIGAFRITSKLLPLATHPDFRHHYDAIDADPDVMTPLQQVRRVAREGDIRLGFHPDQFVVPGSLTPTVSASSLRELDHHARMARWIGAEQLTIHGGGAQPDKATALTRLIRALDKLPATTRELVVLENDDRVFTVQDLLPLCRAHGIPLVYDVHHHRCNPDELNDDEATTAAAATWHGREPWAHLSSPEAAWREGDMRPHAEHINPKDFPRTWLGRTLTVDVEAKGKEHAVLRLQRWLHRQAAEALHPPPSVA